MNRRWLITMATAILIAAFSLASWAQPEVLPGYERSDLHLISQESLPHWTPEWTGPIQGATLLAWLHDNGYARLLRDFNGDGEIDELDTIELANVLGRGLMGTETPIGTTDVRLVVGLARYIADLYPDEFVIKIYDAGFPTEYTQQTRSPFAPDAIAGITMSIEGEPSIDAYEWEMETAEGVILGLEEEERKNTYLSGRSFLYSQTPPRLHPDRPCMGRGRSLAGWTPGTGSPDRGSDGRPDARGLPRSMDARRVHDRHLTRARVLRRH